MDDCNPLLVETDLKGTRFIPKDQGLVARPMPAEIAAEFNRLAVIATDLAQALRWAEAAKEGVAHHEALAIAALVRFSTCFESTAGIRRKPLKPKRIFNRADLDKLDQLRTIRNKVAAHDEQVFPAHLTAMLLDEEAKAVFAVATTATFPFSKWTELQALHELATKALCWVKAELEEARVRAIAAFNALPEEERQKLHAGAPGFRILFEELEIPK